MPITILISMTGHMVVADIYNYFLPLPILYSLCLQRETFQHLSCLWFFTWWGDPNLIPQGSGPLVLPRLNCCSFPLTLTQDMVIETT